MAKTSLATTPYNQVDESHSTGPLELSLERSRREAADPIPELAGQVSGQVEGLASLPPSELVGLGFAQPRAPSSGPQRPRRLGVERRAVPCIRARKRRRSPGLSNGLGILLAGHICLQACGHQAHPTTEPGRYRSEPRRALSTDPGRSGTRPARLSCSSNSLLDGTDQPRLTLRETTLSNGGQ